jgi:ribonuclease-3
MEFLGDALLQASASILVFREHPDWDEGDMSRMRGLLVNTDALRDWAEDLGLALEVGPRSPRPPLKARKAMADALEALLAAVFLDAGAGAAGQGRVGELVERRYLERVRKATKGIWRHSDAKTTLQELAAGRGWPAPVYDTVGRSGKDHAPVFQVRAQVGGREALASAGTLKRAQAEAARLLLDALEGL